MRKHTLKEKLQYKFDNIMSKGTVALVGMLFLVTFLVVMIAGIVVSIAAGSSEIGNNIWISLMHAIDAGTLAGDSTDNMSSVIIFSVVTICGIFVTSILIGIITTGFEEKLNSLRKGSSKVIEKNHTVILGFDDNIYTIISELIVANENEKDGCIVIISAEDKELMEEKIAEQIEDFKTTRVICRSGEVTELNVLEKASLETCRSIILNEQNDFMTIKAILATVSYLKSRNAFERETHIVTTIMDKMNYEAAKIAGEGKVEIIFSKDAIARIIAHTCRQPGLSNVLIELFDYEGDELYFERFPEFVGKRFEEILLSFEKAIVFGIKRDNDILLNPKKDVVITENDQIIYLVEDNGTEKPLSVIPKSKKELEVAKVGKVEESPEHILVLGTNTMLPAIMSELDHYVAKGSSVIIADDKVAPEYVNLKDTLENIVVEIKECDTNDRKNLDLLTSSKINHVLLLSELEYDSEISDAMTLLKLIHLRDIAQKTNAKYSITSEMQNVTNQKLAKVAKVNDLVVGTNIINLILTQISENRGLSAVFTDLLDEDGSEIYMKKASLYVKKDTPVDFYTITEIASRRNEIAIGYKKYEDSTFQVIINPAKSDEITFTEKDYLILLAED